MAKVKLKQLLLTNVVVLHTKCINEPLYRVNWKYDKRVSTASNGVAHTATEVSSRWLRCQKLPPLPVPVDTSTDPGSLVGSSLAADKEHHSNYSIVLNSILVH